MLLLLLGMLAALFAARVASRQSRPVQEHPTAAVTEAPSIQKPSRTQPETVRDCIAAPVRSFSAWLSHVPVNEFR